MAAVDIIMPLYNKASCVRRAIVSIQNQTMSDWKLFVVDDGSTDEGPDIVRKIQDPRIELIHQENQGPGAARNTGIALSTSEYVAFLDADDEWYPWYLANALEAIQNNDVSLVATMYYEWPQKIDMTKTWEKRKVVYGRYSLNGSEDPAWADWLLCFIHVDTTLMRTETARKYGGFYAEENCRYAEDSTFFFRVGVNESFLIIGPPAVRHHRENSSLFNIQDRPLAPFFVNPDIVLRYTPPEKYDLMKKLLDHIALRTAQHKARNGHKEQAIELLNRFPESRLYRRMYFWCLLTIALSRWLPYWVRFKCMVGPPTRIFIKSIACKLGLKQKTPEIS